MHYNNSTAQHAVLYYKGMYQSMRDLNIILSETIHFGNDTISFFVSSFLLLLLLVIFPLLLYKSEYISLNVSCLLDQ